MKLFRGITLSLLCFFVFASCGHKKVKYDSLLETGNSGLRISVEWLKNKRKSMDMRVRFENPTTNIMTISESSLKLTFEGRAGALDTEDKTILLPPNQVELRLLKFSFSPSINKEGLAVLTVDPVVVKDAQGNTHNGHLSVNLPVPPK